MKLRDRSPAIDTHDARALRFPFFRTRLLQLLLVAAAVVFLGLAAASARGAEARTQKGLLPGATGVVVVDLSLSIGPKDYREIRQTLRRLVDDNASLGLVIFSDIGYELLPPGTAASQLRPLIRLFSGSRRRVPVTPWSRSFSAGTQISSAFELAGEMLARDRIEDGSILLISDLITAPEDWPQLARTVRELKRRGIAIRVVPLSPLPDGRTVFRGLLGKEAFIPPSRIGDPQELDFASRGSLSRGFLVLSGLVLLVLAAHERLLGRLALPVAEGRSA